MTTECKDSFEKWARAKLSHNLAKRQNGEYYDPLTEAALVVWEAARSALVFDALLKKIDEVRR